MPDGSHTNINLILVKHVLDEVARAKGKEKEQILKANANSELLQFVVRATYEPSITYGVTKIESVVERDPDLTWDDSVEWTLGQLASRTLSGNTAKLILGTLHHNLTSEGQYLLERIIDRDLKIGCGASTFTKVWPKLLTKFSPMLAHKFEPKRITAWPVFVQPKLDGVRVVAIVEPKGGDFLKGSVEFLSRSGKEFTTFPHLTAYLLDAFQALLDSEDYPMEAEAFVVDGEVVSGSFNKTVSEVRRSSEKALDAQFHVFDVIPRAEFFAGRSSLPLEERRTLTDLLVGKAAPGGPIRLLSTYLANSVVEIEQMFERVRDQGLEGLIVKPRGGHYVNKRSHDWLKIKAEESEDLQVVGAFPGEPGTKYQDCLGGLIVRRHHQVVVAGYVDVRVGGGFSDSQRESFWAAYRRDLAANPSKEVGEILGRIVEVEFHEVTPDGSLRHPRFVRFRDTLQPGVKE